MPRFMQSVSVVIFLFIVAFAAALCISCDADNEDPADRIELPPRPTGNDCNPPLSMIEKLIQQNNLGQAMKLANLYIKNQPQSTEAYIQRGNVKMALAEQAREDKEKCAAFIASAIEDYNRAGKCNNKDFRPGGYRADAYCFMAMLDRENRDRHYERALDEIDAANRLAGKEISTLIDLRNRILAQRGGGRESVAALEKLARDNPNQPQHTEMLARDAFKHGEIDKAHKWLDETLRRNSKSILALLYRASILVEKNRFDDAQADIKKIKQVLAENKENRSAMADELAYLEGILRINRGRYMMRRAKLAKAVKAARDEAAEGIKLLQSLDRENQASDFFVALAQLELSTNNASRHYRQAITKMEQVEGEPLVVMPRLHYGLGLALFSENNNSEVEAAKEIGKAAAYADKIDKIMANPNTRIIDRLLARRACAEAVLTRGKMNLQIMRRPDAAQWDFLKYKELRPWGDEAARIQELLYECELAEIVDKKLTYKDCNEYLKHPYYKIRVVAIKMLSSSDEAQCKQAVAEMLGDKNNTVIRITLNAVKARRIRSNLAGLCALFAHKDEVIAIEALDCAATLKERQTVPALIDALGDKRIAVREEAINTLMSITAHSMFYHYDDDEAQRAAAIKKWREWWAGQN